MMRTSPAQRQRGVVLFISLIVLIAMALAGIALIRSVDTTTIVAGNLAFRQSALNASDQGIEEAVQWLLNNRAALANTKTDNGYYSSQPGTDNPSSWTNWRALPQDSAGNTVSYLIHRLCSLPDAAYNATVSGVANQCATDVGAGGSATQLYEGDSFAVGSPAYASNPNLYYRITTRTSGPRNTVVYTQTLVAIEI